jgi:hypothetical protein
LSIRASAPGSRGREWYLEHPKETVISNTTDKAGFFIFSVLGVWEERGEGSHAFHAPTEIQR